VHQPRLAAKLFVRAIESYLHQASKLLNQVLKLLTDPLAVTQTRMKLTQLLVDAVGVTEIANLFITKSKSTTFSPCDRSALFQRLVEFWHGEAQRLGDTVGSRHLHDWFSALFERLVLYGACLDIQDIAERMTKAGGKVHFDLLKEWIDMVLQSSLPALSIGAYSLPVLCHAVPPPSTHKPPMQHHYSLPSDFMTQIDVVDYLLAIFVCLAENTKVASDFVLAFAQPLFDFFLVMVSRQQGVSCLFGRGRGYLFLTKWKAALRQLHARLNADALELDDAESFRQWLFDCPGLFDMLPSADFEISLRLPENQAAVISKFERRAWYGVGLAIERTIQPREMMTLVALQMNAIAIVDRFITLSRRDPVASVEMIQLVHALFSMTTFSAGHQVRSLLCSL
jgi:hypothetical protein